MRTLLPALVVVAACNGHSHADPEPVAELTQVTPFAPYARELSVDFGVPTELRVAATDGDHTIDVVSPSANSHTVSLYGLYPDRHWTVDMTGGDWSDTLEFDTESLPDTFPHVDVLTSNPAGMQPGWTLASLFGDTESYIVALDADGEVAWTYASGAGLSDLTSHDGGILLLETSDPHWIDWHGRTLACWSDSDSDCTPIATKQNHHDLMFDDSGDLVVMARKTLEVADYPASYDDHSTAPATIATDTVVQIDADSGATVREWDLGTMLDPRRIGFDSLAELDRDLLDWSHANAFALDVARDQWLVEVRHQDAIVAFSRSDSEIQWIFGDPQNWVSPWSDALLEPVGDLRWPYHSHGMKWDGDGTLMVFDNRNYETSPYSGVDATPASQTHSRVAQFTLDLSAGTAAQDWEFELDPPVFSDAVGDADWLENGHVLADFGSIRFVDGRPNGENGRGAATVRLVEFDPVTGEVFYDIDVWAGADDLEAAWRAYRLERVPIPE